ncbi:MAG TPA: hypothetical protein VMZ71_14415, partial [Gemmataceae bacterium]|nr:hypothetical protein [Gemmataceae bacterium]
MSAKNPFRRAAVVIGTLAVLTVGGVVVSRTAWFRALIARDTVNPAEMDRLSRAPLIQMPPTTTPVGWPQWLGPTRDGRAPAGPFRADWDKNPPKELWNVPCGAGYSSFAV